MEVEPGLHRVLGFYTAFPELAKKAGLEMKHVVIWKDEVEVKLRMDLPLFMECRPSLGPLKHFLLPSGTDLSPGSKHGNRFNS